MPPDELTDRIISSIQWAFSAGRSGVSNSNRRGIDGCSQIVERPGDAPDGCCQDMVKLYDVPGARVDWFL